jgi:hypothetical protein
VHRSLLRFLVLASFLVGAGVILILQAEPARADLVLNEVLYDPAGLDDGAEFVELWNPDSLPRDLAGVAIEVADGARPGVWTAIFHGASENTIAAGGLYLAAGPALSASMQNGPDAIRLTRGALVLDRVGYGELSAPELFEGMPAPDVASGHSLARREDGADTDQNADDWEDEGIPTPGRANHPRVRIALVPGGVRLDPVVSWPGDEVSLGALVRNRGRLPVEGSLWRLVVERGDATDSLSAPLARGDALPAAIHPGVTLASGESAWVETTFPAMRDGPFRAIARIAPEDGVTAAEGLADTAFVAARTRASPAVIQEIAFHDAGAGEWVELWIREPVADVGQLSLADASSSPRAIARGEAPRPLDAGVVLVVAQNPEAVRARYSLDSTLVLGVAGGWPSLNDSDGDAGFADVVRVVAAEGYPSDVVPYDARSVTRGGTLERLSPDLPGQLAGSWAECIDPARATPGRPNSLRAPGGGSKTRGALLVASARVLRRSAIDAPLLLRLTQDARGRSLRVQVLDLIGRRVRTLVRDQRFASEGAFVWDGRDGSGAWVPPGLYVITAEAAPEGHRGPRRTAIPVAVVPEGGAP